MCLGSIITVPTTQVQHVYKPLEVLIPIDILSGRSTPLGYLEVEGSVLRGIHVNRPWLNVDILMAQGPLVQQ